MLNYCLSGASFIQKLLMFCRYFAYAVGAADSVAYVLLMFGWGVMEKRLVEHKECGTNAHFVY